MMMMDWSQAMCKCIHLFTTHPFSSRQFPFKKSHDFLGIGGRKRMSFLISNLIWFNFEWMPEWKFECLKINHISLGQVVRVSFFCRMTSQQRHRTIPIACCRSRIRATVFPKGVCFDSRSTRVEWMSRNMGQHRRTRHAVRPPRGTELSTSLRTRNAGAVHTADGNCMRYDATWHLAHLQRQSSQCRIHPWARGMCQNDSATAAWSNSNGDNLVLRREKAKKWCFCLQRSLMTSTYSVVRSASQRMTFTWIGTHFSYFLLVFLFKIHIAFLFW